MDAKLLKTLMKKKTEETNPRLQSLRLPRDLSLGGTKPKKVYVPNVNVVRNKDKEKELLKNLDKKRKERTREPKNRAFKGSQRFIQSSGIFSDGAAEQRRSTAFSERTHYSRSDNDSAGNAISVPTYNKRNLMIDKQREDVVLDELMNYDEEIDDEKTPLMPIIWKKQDDEVELKVKKENQLNGDLNNHVYVDTERRIPYFHKIDDDENNYRLALLKLPDSLAGKGLSDDPNETKIFDYPLNVMLEGKIGTLQIRRSGRMYMKIGHVKYLLESTDFFSGNESVAVLAEPSLGREKPNLALIGNVEEQFVLNPIWNCLLKS